MPLKILTIIFYSAVICACSNACVSNDTSQLKSERKPKALKTQTFNINKYIVVTSKVANVENEIKLIFKQYGLTKIKPLSSNMFLIVLQNNPGEADIQMQISKFKFIKSIQRNFKYNTSPSNNKSNAY